VSAESREVSEVVPLGLLRRYLLANGWRVSEPPTTETPLHLAATTDLPARTFLESRAKGKRNIDVFVLSESGLDDVELVIPRDQDVSDLDRRLQGAVSTLSQVEDRSTSEVIASVRSIGFDVVRSRIPDALVMDDTIYLANATDYINGMRDLLAITATTELRPLPFFGRVSKEAAEYSDKCRFGHTYHGSFGFTIESPITPNTTRTLFGTDPFPPFERRVVQRMAIGIQQICTAATTDDLRPLIDGVRIGFSANGCERFANLVHDTAYSGMSFAFSFSPEWAMSDGLGRSPEFFVGPKHVEVARAAANSLRGDPIELPTEVYGRVVRLQNEADPSDISATTGEREISVFYSSEDYGDLHLRMTLSPADYLLAVEAHRLGRPVRVRGTLVHKGRSWFLLNPAGLTVPYEPGPELL
jgi:hypothetical protein